MTVNESSEADYLSDIDPYNYAYEFEPEVDPEYRDRDVLHRTRPNHTIYAIQATSPYTGDPIYLQSNQMRGRQKWTLFESNARWFNSKEEAQAVCKKFKYNKPHVVVI